ncbi:MAG: glycoside hydrolase [Elusimicrobia bacterium CG_4_10_14_0_2_um_filter_56_8]|nr:MAG: glycoside hydrolase [Elusimicrobia bacterium CG1_02_56_21]PJA16951.1 MAG: glycoside hydrolase [Elusimicrobia bacterium CG_4_10_14_0_2_um_filter_56_8]
MNKKFACIHGHFYQPPRENPWLEEVELQDSAYPHHDWNDRITEECYAPNTASRLLDGEGRVADIVNNYSRMSFNFGPTLLSWLQRHHLGTYKAVLEADVKSRELFSGHGSAIAQCYSHMIMPLAGARDKRTQVLWGLRDFEFRFGRKAEGIWLPETAVDLATLSVLAEAGVKFTILAPAQARSVRRTGVQDWTDVSGSKVDPRRPYLCRLPDGKSIVIFFYDGPLSREIAFNGVLNDGNVFLKRLTSVLDQDPAEPQLAHIATDGETYGHHHRRGDMALAYCISNVQADPSVRITIYGEFLEKNPPAWEAEIWENSSWSCAHGLERWRSDCGCNSGGKPEWNQKWRAPLRGALDWLRDNLAEIYVRQSAGLLSDPWAARDAYIDIILDRSDGTREAFLARHRTRELSREESLKVMRLLEMQRNAMLMYTSCGWFFDEISGLETVQILGYASRSMQLALQASGVGLENAFLDLLERAPSNLPEFGNGRKIYESFVMPATLDLLRVGVHYGVSSVFEKAADDGDIYCYSIRKRSLEVLESGPQKLAVGMLDITSKITTETNTASFVMLYLGGYNILGAAREFMGSEGFDAMSDGIKGAFAAGNLADMTRLISENFPQGSYSLWHLFKDEQRKVIDQIFSAARSEMIASFRQIYNHHSAILDVTSRLRAPLPSSFVTVAQSVLNDDISRALKAAPVDAAGLKRAAALIGRFSFSIDRSAIGLTLTEKLNRLADAFGAEPENALHLERISEILEAVSPLGLELNLWRVQNIFFKIGRPMAAAKNSWAASGNAGARLWVDLFEATSALLKVRFNFS